MTTGTEVIGPVAVKGADAVPSPSLDQVREFIRASKSENALRGYQSDWRAFCAWCGVHRVCPMPATAETVAAFIAECAGRLKVGSVQRRLNAIAEAHKAVGLESPTHHAMVINTLKGIRRTKGTAPVQKLRRSKTDQAGAGRKIGIPYGSNPETCPVRNLQSWIEQAGISGGPLFRSINRHGQVQPGGLSGIDVARVVKKLAERAGLDAAKYAGHSLRAGHATSAAIAGASERSIMNQTGHRSVQMVRRYIRDGSLFRENSAGKLGL